MSSGCIETSRDGSKAFSLFPMARMPFPTLPADYRCLVFSQRFLCPKWWQCIFFYHLAHCD